MKLIIVGSRDLYINSPLSLHDLLLYTFNYKMPSEIISGGARGIDQQAEECAGNNNIPFKLFEADWEEHGKAAGPIRNKQMAEYGDVLFLIWDGESRGSKNMKEEMFKLNKPIYEVILRKYNVGAS